MAAAAGKRPEQAETNPFKDPETRAEFPPKDAKVADNS
jgi:hypothetical protein